MCTAQEVLLERARREEAEGRAEGRAEERKKGIQRLIAVLRGLGLGLDDIRKKLAESYSLNEHDAEAHLKRALALKEVSTTCTGQKKTLDRGKREARERRISRMIYTLEQIGCNGEEILNVLVQNCFLDEDEVRRHVKRICD